MAEYCDDGRYKIYQPPIWLGTGKYQAKPGKNIVVVLLTLLILALPYSANSQVDSVAGNRKWEITIDGKLISPSSIFGLEEWMYPYSIRAGLGTQILPSLWGHAFVEYRRFNSGLRRGEHYPLFFERNYQRSDVAFYLSLTTHSFFQIGAGVIGRFQEDMLYRYNAPDTVQRVMRAPKGLNLFLITGIKYDIPIGSDFYLPVGLFVSSHYLSDYTTLRDFIWQDGTLRVGISKRF